MRPSLPRPARLALRLLAVSGVALATANCSTAPQQKFASAGNGVDPKYGVKASPRLYNEGDVIPKGGGRRFTGKPYVVAGQTYTPRENPSGYVREGLASWYGSAFHGRQTANGEVFDRHSIAAAHPTLPLPSYARVTNLENGHSMVVRVNDRGPYHAGRVMDVSEEAADALGFHRRGTARVRVEYVGKAAVAGSDDRKLLASLRTDGRPAGVRSTVMMADLGDSGAPEPERYARPASAPLAFKPAPAREEADEAPAAAPAPRPVRAPVVLARATVSVPAAVQPTALRTREFRPAPVRVAGLNPKAEAAAAPPAAKGHPKAVAAPMRLAAATPHALSAPGARSAPAQRAPAAVSSSEKLALARLSEAAAPKAGAAKSRGEPATKQAAAPVPPGKRPARLAGIY